MVGIVTRLDSSSKLDEFEGKVVSVDLEMGLQDRKQYHVQIEPTSFKLESATGHAHEWISLSPRATEEGIPQGSVMDKYLMQVEICISAAKQAKTVGDAMKMLVGKTFKFKKLKLGRDFNGQPAREYICPVMLIR